MIDQDEATIRIVEAAHRRRDATHTRIHDAMATMEAEIEANGGVYPGNKGKITLSEVYARAGVGRSTMGEEHHKGLIAEVKAWIAKRRKVGPVVKKDVVLHQRDVMAALGARIEVLAADAQAWAAKCAEAEAAIAARDRRIEDLEAEIERLRGAGGKVTSLKGRRKDG